MFWATLLLFVPASLGFQLWTFNRGLRHFHSVYFVPIYQARVVARTREHASDHLAERGALFSSSFRLVSAGAHARASIVFKHQLSFTCNRINFHSHMQACQLPLCSCFQVFIIAGNAVAGAVLWNDLASFASSASIVGYFVGLTVTIVGAVLVLFTPHASCCAHARAALRSLNAMFSLP